MIKNFLESYNKQRNSIMFLTTIIVAYRVTSGVIPNKKLALIVMTLIRILITTSIGGMIDAIFAASKESYRTTTVGMLLCITFSASLQLITKFHENSLLTVISKLRQETYIFSHKRINYQSEVEAERRYWLTILFLMVTCITPLFCPYYYFFTASEIAYDSPDLQTIPFFMPRWKVNTMIEYVEMVMLQYSVTGVSITAYWSFTIFTVYVVVHLQKHVQELNDQVNKLIDFYLQNFFETRDVHQDEVFVKKRTFTPHEDGVIDQWFDKELKNIIKYQQFINSYITDFVKFLNRPYTSVFSWYISSTIIFAYSFLQIVDDVAFFIKTSSMVIHGTVALYCFCQTAQIVSEMNDSIKDAFYNSKWYYLPPKFRKSLIVILIQCQRKHKIRSFSMYIVNLNLFVRSLRIVYSVLNVVLMMQKK